MSRDGYFFEGLNILISSLLYVYALTASELFTTLYNYQHFLLLSNFSSFLKCLLKSPSKYSSLWLVDFLQCRPLLSCKENAQELTFNRQLPLWFYRITGGFLYAFSVSKSLHCFRVFKAGYWQDFKISRKFY